MVLHNIALSDRRERSHRGHPAISSEQRGDQRWPTVMGTGYTKTSRWPRLTGSASPMWVREDRCRGLRTRGTPRCDRAAEGRSTERIDRGGAGAPLRHSNGRRLSTSCRAPDTRGAFSRVACGPLSLISTARKLTDWAKNRRRWECCAPPLPVRATSITFCSSQGDARQLLAVALSHHDGGPEDRVPFSR